jgi:hypothetical protein
MDVDAVSLPEVTDLLGLRGDLVEVVPVDDAFGSPFRVTEAAAASVGAALAAVATFHASRTGSEVTAHLDGRHAAVAFHGERLVRAPAWEDLELWDPLAGNYPTADGWIRLHTNLERHRHAAVTALGVAPEREAVAAALAARPADGVEQAVVEAGGVAARMRTRDEYLRHPQRAAVLERPVVDVAEVPASDAPARRRFGAGRALEGVRVLDLTRVIAGPVAGRFLASFGADVVRVDPPLDDSLLLEIETGSGKRRTSIDLHRPDGQREFERLLAGADVLVEGFRPGALAGAGYADERLRAVNPTLVIGHLSAYGDRGPWAGRRGFDSVVQVATGLAHACGFDPAGGPGKLPAQALDHASGYLLAAGLVAALVRRQRDGRGGTVHVSLARTAEWLADLGGKPDGGARAPSSASISDLMDLWPASPWGPIEHVRPVGRLGDHDARWARPPAPRSDDRLSWLEPGGQ